MLIGTRLSAQDKFSLILKKSGIEKEKRGHCPLFSLPHFAAPLTVLPNRSARQECVQIGTTHFCVFLTVSTLFIKIIVLCRSILAYILTQTYAGKLFLLIFSSYIP